MVEIVTEMAVEIEIETVTRPPIEPGTAEIATTEVGIVIGTGTWVEIGGGEEETVEIRTPLRTEVEIEVEIETETETVGTEEEEE